MLRLVQPHVRTCIQIVQNHTGFAALTIFFLLFPGLICSVGFLILHCVGHRKIGKIPPTSVMAYFFAMLLFYPVVPIVL